MSLEPLTPNYTLAEAAMYTRLSVSTIGRWARGWGDSVPVIQTDTMLSLVNLVELHMLSMFRHQHRVSLQRIRRAVGELARQKPHSVHPLATEQFWTDGQDILVEKVGGDFVSLNEPGQMAFGEVIGCYAKRVEWDGDLPVRLYPWTVNQLARYEGNSNRMSVMVDPHVAFGRAVVAGTRVTTKSVKDLWDVGTLVSEIADDLQISEAQVQDAVRLEEARPIKRAG